MKNSNYISKLFKFEELDLSILSLFGWFGAFNYPIFYAYWKYFSTSIFDDFWFRAFATLLCVPLIFVRQWPSFLHNLIRPYWYFVITYSVPFFAAYSLMENKFSGAWELNVALGLFLLILVLNWREFFISLSLGSIFGAFAYRIFSGPIDLEFVDFTTVIVNLVWMVVTALLFLRRNKLTVQEKIDNMKMLAGTIAHEIRTPLSSITMKGRVLRKAIEMQEVEEGRKFSPESPLKILPSEIVNVANGAQTIIDMTLAKFRESPLSYHDTLNISTIIKEALDQYPFEGTERGRVHWQSNVNFYFKGDAEFFTHVIFNLLKNSLYFTEINFGKIFIWTEIEGDKGKLFFKDTGPGISKYRLKHIFRAFHSKRRQGTGLGLAFCKNTIESFNGSIKCESKLGEYTTFIISLPIVSKVHLEKAQIKPSAH